MATDARSGVARSGDVYSGDTSLEPLAITFAGTTRTTQVEDLAITLNLEGPSAATGRLTVSSISAGQAVEVWRGGVSVGVPLFGGNVVQLQPKAARFSEPVRVDWTATDYRWLLDQTTRVTTRVQGRGVNVTVRTFLTTYAPSGFTAGYLPSTLGDISEMQFTDERLSVALDRIAAQVDGRAFWGVDPQKRVSMWLASEDPPHLQGATLAITDATTHRSPKIDLDLTNIRTRVIAEGGGSATSSIVGTGAMAVAVDEVGWYAAGGGGARAAQVVFTYAGTSPSSGPGVLTGCTGVTDDIPQGETVYVREQADDSSAQTALATLVGGSGIAVHVVKDGRINAATAATKATAALTLYDDLIRGLTYDTDEEVHTVPGRTVAVSITRPAVLQQTVRIQSVEIEKFGKVTATSTVLVRRVDTRPTRITLAQILRGDA